MKSAYYYISVLILFAVYFVNGLIAIPQLSVTSDESDHLSYGMRVAKLQSQKTKPFDDASTMPLSALNALPRALEQVADPSLKKTDGGISDIFSGRYMTLLVSGLIGLYLLIFATELYGRRAGIFSLFLFVFCPNITGHAVLVTTDAYSALFTLTSAWYFRKALLQPSWRYTALFGLHLGLAQLSKQSLTHLYFIFLLLLIIYLFAGKLKMNIKTLALHSVLTGAILLFVINTGFFFRGTGNSLDEYRFRSRFFQSFQHSFSFAGGIPLPLPEPYLSGLDLTKNIDEIGPGRPESSGRVYLLGRYGDGKGFWYYYFVVIFFKTPIPVLLLTGWLLIDWYRNRTRFPGKSSVFLFTIGYFLVYFNFFYNSQVGLRHLLMIYPLWYLLLARLADAVLKKRWVWTGLAAWSVISYYSYFPNLIAYSNEFLLPKRNAYKVMASSNIDYRQGYFLLQRYLRQHKDVRQADTIPAPGKQVLGINEYLDLRNDHRYEWLRRFEPAGHVAHTYLLFDIKKSDINGQ